MSGDAQHPRLGIREGPTITIMQRRKTDSERERGLPGSCEIFPGQEPPFYWDIFLLFILIRIDVLCFQAPYLQCGTGSTLGSFLIQNSGSSTHRVALGKWLVSSKIQLPGFLLTCLFCQLPREKGANLQLQPSIRV